MTEQQIFDLLKNIRRFENRDGEFFKGWEAALDTVECDFKGYFAAKTKESHETSPDNVPRKGERWRFVPDNDESPWPNEEVYDPIRILDVKSGWVRYRMGSVFPDEKMTMKNFVRMYRRIE